MWTVPTTIAQSLGLAVALIAAAAAPLAVAQSGDPNADAMKQVQQMQNDPRYKEMMKNPQVREALEAATKNANKGPIVEGGVARVGLPKRDTARLATVSRTAPTQAQLAAYIPKVHAAVMNLLPSDQRSAVLDLIAQLKADSPGALEAAASNLWILGKPDLAILLMGQAASDHPDQPNTLNNYAAFLTMLGGEPEAIPILQRLALQFPNDSTVQSNLGQAWFGLGDMAEAKKHLDNAVRIFPGHSQANETIADIDEANGDPVGETQALERSIETSYSEEKAARLEKLGRKVDPQSIPWRVHMAQDPMGLEQFKTPAFCKGVGDAKDCAARWQEFDDQLSSKLAVLSAKYTKVQQQIVDRSKKASDKAQAPHASMADMMSAANELARTTGLGQLANSPMTAVAQPRYHAAIDDLGQTDKKIESDTAPVYAQIAAVRKTYGAQRAAIEQKYAPLFGEGETPGIEEQYCSAIDGVENSESAEVNPLLENAYQLSRPRILRAYNDYVYYSQFENDDLSFEAVKIHQQQMFLAWLSGIHGVPYEGSRCTKKKPQKQSMVLQDFYDVHCEHIITFSVPKIGSFDVHCNKMTTKLDLSVKLGEVTLSAKGTMKENLDTSRIIGARAEQGVKIGVDQKIGPVKAAASAEGKSFIELDDHGVTNVGGGLSGTVGVGPATVTVDSNVSWNAGASGSASATLGGMTVKSN
jgi:tetratricopeptide (TPR) repeat protein